MSCRGTDWLTEQQFLDAVAIAMITPGPVVITVAFIGYLVAGFPGATLAAIGIFLPVWVLTVIPAPWFVRHRNNAQLRAFSDGATAAASGAIAGAVVVLGQRAIVDVPTAAIALVSLGLLWRFKIPEPLLVVIAGCSWARAVACGPVGSALRLSARQALSRTHAPSPPTPSPVGDRRGGTPLSWAFSPLPAPRARRSGMRGSSSIQGLAKSAILLYCPLCLLIE